MIDSFGDFKALLPINHRLVEGMEMRGNMAGHIQREGLHTGKSYGKMVPRAGERHQETREKMNKARWQASAERRQRGETQVQVCCQREGVNVLLA